MKKTIFVCDDDQSIIEVLTIILTQQGYDVFPFDKSDEIVEKAKCQKPSVILLDLQIPGDGTVAATVLKSDVDTHSIPLIIFSAHPHIEEITRTIGADGYIRKPFDVIEFEQQIEKFIKGK